MNKVFIIGCCCSVLLGGCKKEAAKAPEATKQQKNTLDTIVKPIQNIRDYFQRNHWSYPLDVTQDTIVVRVYKTGSTEPLILTNPSERLKKYINRYNELYNDKHYFMKFLNEMCRKGVMVVDSTHGHRIVALSLWINDTADVNNIFLATSVISYEYHDIDGTVDTLTLGAREGGAVIEGGRIVKWPWLLVATLDKNGHKLKYSFADP